jgi:hypothetical protein
MLSGEQRFTYTVSNIKGKFKYYLSDQHRDPVWEAATGQILCSIEKNKKCIQIYGGRNILENKHLDDREYDYRISLR